MKKLTLTIAIVLGMALVSFGQSDQKGGGLFKRGDLPATSRSSRGDAGDPLLPILPNYGTNQDQDAVPVGSGIAVLLGLGGAYLVAKKRKQE